MIKQLFRTELITSVEQFAACRRAWNELAGTRLFHRWEWMYHWWQAFGSDSKLVIVTIVDGNGRWIGIAPWFKTVSTRQGSIVRQLASGTACSDYASLAIRPGYEAIAGAIIAEIIDGTAHSDVFGDVDLFELEGHLGDDPGIAFLLEALDDGRARVTQEEFAGTWQSQLPDSWEDFEGRLHRSFRRKTRKASRRLGQPEFTARALWDPASIADAWPTFSDLHQRRRQSLGDPGCFADPRFESFLANATVSLAESARAQINLLEYMDRPLAANLEFVAGDSVYMYQTGFDPGYIELEPGHITFTWAIQASIERGFQNFDFLRGDEPYKSRWKSSRIPLYRTQIVPNRLPARLRQGVRVAGRHVRNWTRSVRAVAGNTTT